MTAYPQTSSAALLFPPLTRPRAICPSSPRLPDSLAVCLRGWTGVGTYVCVCVDAGWVIEYLLCSYLWCNSYPPWGPAWTTECWWVLTLQVWCFVCFFFVHFHSVQSNFKSNCCQVEDKKCWAAVLFVFVHSFIFVWPLRCHSDIKPSSHNANLLLQL